MRVGVSRNGRNILKQKKAATPQDFNKGMVLIKRLADEITYGRPIEAVAGGIAGPLDKKKVKLVNSPNLPGWINKPLGTKLKKLFKAPIFLENDMALVGLGEATEGAGKGFKIVSYLTISSGVNGSRIVDGSIDRNAIGFEIGNQIIDSDKGVPKTLEELIGGVHLEKRWGKPPSEISDPRIWRGLIKWLVYGLNNIIVHWSPEVIVLGGSVSNRFFPYLNEIRDELRKTVVIFPLLPELRQAALKDSGGLYGALVLIKQNFKL